LTKVKWAITAFFLTLGILTLAAYVKIGYEHRFNVGERYNSTVEINLQTDGKVRV
jgi:fumarate reductase subunit C